LSTDPFQLPMYADYSIRIGFKSQRLLSLY